MNKSNFKHFHHDHVRWGDCDQLGHVNNTKYLQYIESGRLDYFFTVLGIELRPDSAEGFVMLDLKCQFKKQVHYPSNLEIATRISRVGNSSAMVEAAVFIAGEENPVFTSSCTSVWCDYEKGVSTRLPDALRKLIQDHEGEIEGLSAA